MGYSVQAMADEQSGIGPAPPKNFAAAEERRSGRGLHARADFWIALGILFTTRPLDKLV
jgi:hypothetical protein